MKEKFKLVTQYPVVIYDCGLKAGQEVRLKADLHIEDHNGVRTGKVYRKGEVWKTLSGDTGEHRAVWFKRPDGKRHTWSDDKTLFDTFEIVE